MRGFVQNSLLLILLLGCASTPTDAIVVFVLPPLEAGILAKPDTICLNEDVLLEFEIGASGAEWNWGGFLEFSYQWQQNNATGRPFRSIDEKGWFDVGGDWNIYLSALPAL